MVGCQISTEATFTVKLNYFLRFRKALQKIERLPSVVELYGNIR